MKSTRNSFNRNGHTNEKKKNLLLFFPPLGVICRGSTRLSLDFSYLLSAFLWVGKLGRFTKSKKFCFVFFKEGLLIVPPMFPEFSFSLQNNCEKMVIF